MEQTLSRLVQVKRLVRAVKSCLEPHVQQKVAVPTAKVENIKTVQVTGLHLVSLKKFVGKATTFLRVHPVTARVVIAAAASTWIARAIGLHRASPR